MEYEWKINTPSDEELKDYSSDNHIIAAALYNRHIPLEAARNMVTNSYGGIYDPIPLFCKDKAVDLLYQFICKPDGKIYIFGDYDTDGITSTVIALGCLENFHYCICKENTNWQTAYKIPERIDGYGLSANWCNKLIEVEKNNEDNILVITVDNGITKREETDLLLNVGISVLVTDHHRPDYENNVTPRCICVNPQIDPNQEGIQLAGCGVIFNLLRYFEDKYLEGDHSTTDEYEYLMGIGTVGDMMKMDYYHGCAVTEALDRINSDRCPVWLDELKTYLGIEHVTAKTIGWNIAAFINACGQSNQANLAASIIMEPDMMQREILFKQANDLYKAVKDITKKEKQRAEEEIVKLGLDKHNVIIYGLKTDYPGIVGKVAHHLSMITNKPAIVYNDKDEEEVHGSSRNTNDSIPFYDILKEAQKLGIIISANGHSFAQGCDFYKKQIQELIQFIDEKIEKRIQAGTSSFSVVKNLYIDQIIDLNDISMRNVQAIESFPWNNNWQEPSVCILNAKIAEVRHSANNIKNVCYRVHNPNGQDVEFWAWNIKPFLYDPSKHTKISLVGTLSRDFRYENRPMFNVTDFKLA